WIVVVSFIGCIGSVIVAYCGFVFNVSLLTNHVPSSEPSVSTVHLRVAKLYPSIEEHTGAKNA
ncbi:hypothetical protein M514_28385, partial [Trichuris suis]